MRYRCADTTGRTYFFTVNLVVRSSELLVGRIGAERQIKSYADMVSAEFLGFTGSAQPTALMEVACY